ncbi:sarcosine oxidase subunit delta [Nonomuraea fuscirosea]|uniref:sarcosine oxidase subunit delta n=1 Tax=Nonomuraea fuscirosea TaxID=1291556 RepID=UPI00349142BE
MLLIDCPHCGPRDENEYHHGGQAGIPYPLGETTDEEWAAFVFLRDNPKGWFRERWFHVHGCRTWFDVERHTVTHEVRKAR